MRSPLLIGIFTIAAILSVFWFGSEIVKIVQNPVFSDFRVYFNAAQAAKEGKPIYDVHGMRETTFDPFYKYPPLAAHLLRFFVSFGLRKMAFTWFFMSIAFYITALVVWIVISGIPIRSIETLLLISMLFASQPAVDSLNGPQTDCFMLFLLFLCYWGTIRNWPILSGGSIAVQTMIKVFPAALLLPFIQTRRFRHVVMFMIVFTALLIISIFLGGFESHKEFLLRVLPVNSTSSAYVENQSLFAFLARFVVDGSEWNSGRPTNVPFVMWITRIIAIVMLISMFYLNSRSNRKELMLPAIVVWLLISLPVAWIHYQTLLFFPLAIFLHQQLQNEAQDRLGWIVFSLSCVCVLFGNQHLMLNMPALFQSYKFYGVMMLWMLYMRSMVRLQKRDGFEPS